MQAYGKDLCNGEERKKLIDDAQKKLNGQAGGGGGTGSGGSTAPPPNSTTPAPPEPQKTGAGFTYTPPSGGNPGYFTETDVNGRQTIHLDLPATPSSPSNLPPTTENVVPTTTASGNGEVTGCATDTWTAMVNQSVLQTRREMAMNQRFVVKPDSVMSYSCLGEQLKLVGEQIGPVFNEAQLWVNREIDILNGATVKINVDMGRTALDGAVVNVATEPYEAWTKSVFNHDYLGGQAPGIAGAPDEETGAATQDHAPCGAMAKVWDIAKCMNFNDDPAFPKFEELVGNDPRKYPPNYSCNDTGITQNMITIARNGQVQKTPYETHLNMIYPTSGCHAAIPTGITVERQEGATQITTKKTYPDGLCISVGCSYQSSGSSAGSCAVKGP